jgi:uncharacterized protein YjbI with pentapeptide repeats
VASPLRSLSERPLSWELCERQPGCTGARLDRWRSCLAHLTPEEREAYLGGGELDARGTTVEATLLADVGALILRQGRPSIGPCAFSGARIGDGARFEDWEFREEADFADCVFEREVTFRNAVFVSGSLFDDARFRGSAAFTDAACGHMGLVAATFEQEADFSGCTFTTLDAYSTAFGSEAVFWPAKFSEDVHLNDCRFGRAMFQQAVFDRELDFSESTFARGLSLEEARCNGAVWLDSTRIEGDLECDGMSVATSVFGKDLDVGGKARLTALNASGPIVIIRSRFAADVDLTGGRLSSITFSESAVGDTLLCSMVTIEEDSEMSDVTARKVRFAQAKLEAPLILRVACEELDIIRCDVAGRLSAHVKDGNVHLDVTRFAAPGIIGGTGALLSAHDASLENLSLSRLDLSRCVLSTAGALDTVRIESVVRLARAPGRFSARRRVIADEIVWRAQRRGRLSRLRAAPWRRLAHELSLETEPAFAPAEIASTYRDLRKGREERKDAPGAADFYYGEMEMRRCAGRRSVEAGILTLYWLSCGYLLRAWRACVLLLLLVAAGAAAIQLAGLDESWRASAQRIAGATLPTSIVGARAPYSGDAAASIVLAVHLLGPLVLGLIAFSIRGRVRR